MKHEIYIGCNDRNTHRQELTEKEIMQTIGAEVGDCSLTPMYGIYHGELEKSFKVDVFSEDSAAETARLQEAAVRLCIKLNQNEIIVDGEFIRHPEDK